MTLKHYLDIEIKLTTEMLPTIMEPKLKELVAHKIALCKWLLDIIEN